MKRVFAGMFLLCGFGFALSACSGEETHSVEWYRDPANKVVFHAKIEECKNNPGELRDTPNCVNAYKAFELNSLGAPLKK